ncbi:mitochondrial ribosomal protein L48 [Xylocopa sonorina]|uniref:mitochondrial ribosomal protein L48 n=1 Tax=Xylocopa sonorina TaxID=1818115 RepID=UPI00403AC5D0
MVLNVLKQVTTHYRCLIFKKAVRFYGIYEPPYLKQKELEIPVYPVLNIQLRGYKYPLLESYQSFIHKLARVLDFKIDDSFAFPHKEYKIKRFKKGTSVTDTEYNLKIYERDMLISNVSSIKCPILIRILEATLPEGVTLHIDNYDPSIQKLRIIPNKELLDLKDELNAIYESRSK